MSAPFDPRAGRFLVIAPVVERFGLPRQWTVRDHLDANDVRKGQTS
ncbi:MAG: hypothetical protein JO048_09105 [Methylobacteriaceae bacterium]|nr:hypothetical protein [Methylobacteriaceae bacterium]